VFIESCALTDGAVVEADLCILGSGPAGLAIARELLGSGLRVVVLEAGGKAVSWRAQALYRAEAIGAPNHAATHSRFRTYGGSATRWTGQCVPLETIDFERRSAVPDSGWPFGADELRPWYERAGELLGLVPPENLRDEPEQDIAAADPALARTLIRFARPTDLGAHLEATFAASRDVDVLLDANVLEIVAGGMDRQVTHVACRGASGRRFTCRATRFVLACGGIENARLLLASRSRTPAGLGNERDVVGRYFHDHPYLVGGYWRPSATATTRGLHVIDDFERIARERCAHSALTLVPEIRRREGLAACVGYFVHRDAWQLAPDYHAPGGRAVVHAAELLRGERVPDRDIVTSLRALAGNPGPAVRTIGRALAARGHSEPRLALRMVLESAPHRDSRVTLGGATDTFGMPRAVVDWRIGNDDWRGAARLRTTLARAIRTNGLGELVEDHATDDAGWPISLSGGKHHMGTTRMHENPALGVVDANACVHSLENLFVAGSSVFPTGGWANPTLTIVALAIRLADHLRRTT